MWFGAPNTQNLTENRTRHARGPIQNISFVTYILRYDIKSVIQQVRNLNTFSYFKKVPSDWVHLQNVGAELINIAYFISVQIFDSLKSCLLKFDLRASNNDCFKISIFGTLLVRVLYFSVFGLIRENQ